MSNCIDFKDGKLCFFPSKNINNNQNFIKISSENSLTNSRTGYFNEFDTPSNLSSDFEPAEQLMRELKAQTEAKAALEKEREAEFQAELQAAIARGNYIVNGVEFERPYMTGLNNKHIIYYIIIYYYIINDLFFMKFKITFTFTS